MTDLAQLFATPFALGTLVCAGLAGYSVATNWRPTLFSNAAVLMFGALLFVIWYP